MIMAPMDRLFSSFIVIMFCVALIVALGLSTPRAVLAQGNTMFGTNALANNVSGVDNSGFCDDALFSNQNGNSNTAVGAGALGGNAANSYSENTAVGVDALQGITN